MILMLGFGLSAGAQGIDKKITIENTDIEVKGSSVDIRFDLLAEGIAINCNGHLKLEFAVENGDRRLVLPAVIYSGAQRYRYEQRRLTLSNGYQLKPYHVYRKVRKNSSYELEYKMTIPYYEWMEHATITYREYLHDCSGDNQSGQGVLVADLVPAPLSQAHTSGTSAPNAALYPNMVSFLVPEAEEVKARTSMLELKIDFPVNVTEVRSDYMDNRRKLARADSLITLLQSNDLIQIEGVNIKGYASPEGSYARNEQLARGRSENFKQYLVRNHPGNQYLRDAKTSWEPEDWIGFGRLMEADNSVVEKDDVRAIIYDNTIAPDTKDVMLQKIVWWSQNYEVILKTMYPKLRYIELKVDYTVRNIDRNDDAKVRELLYTNPDMLSLDEIYRVAQFYTPGTEQYREVYEIAARQHPDDVIANNNAAAALLQEGNADAALPYLEKIRDNEVSYINFGTYWYIKGNPERATEYFNKAEKAGIEQAGHNLRIVNSSNNR